jgi:hypothetical protein
MKDLTLSLENWNYVEHVRVTETAIWKEDDIQDNIETVTVQPGEGSLSDDSTNEVTDYHIDDKNEMETRPDQCGRRPEASSYSICSAFNPALCRMYVILRVPTSSRNCFLPPQVDDKVRET